MFIKGFMKFPQDALQEDALINRWLASQLKEWIVILKRYAFIKC